MAERASASAWVALSEESGSSGGGSGGGGSGGGGGAQRAALSREAYVIAQVLLCASRHAAGDASAALRSLDRAFIVGGETQLHRDCVELLEEEATPQRAEPKPPPPSRGLHSVEAAAAAAAAAAVGSSGPPAPPSCSRLERVPPPRGDAFRALRRRGLPLLIDGVASEWAAMRRCRLSRCTESRRLGVEGWATGGGGLLALRRTVKGGGSVAGRQSVPSAPVSSRLFSSLLVSPRLVSPHLTSPRLVSSRLLCRPWPHCAALSPGGPTFRGCATSLEAGWCLSSLARSPGAERPAGEGRRRGASGC